MRLNVLVSVLLFVGGISCCSIIRNVPYYPVTQRTILAPIVVHGRVINTTRATFHTLKYEACIQVLEVIKSENNRKVPREMCFGDFGSDVLCLTQVFSDTEYIFYMTSNWRANYKDGEPKRSVDVATRQTLDLAKQGVCDPFLSQSSPCRRPRIKRDNFQSIVRVQEGQTAEMACYATGTFPLVVSWSKRGFSAWGHTVPHTYNKLQIPSVTMSDMGVYECTIRNPAGQATVLVRLFIERVPCGAFLYLRPGQQSQIQSPNYPLSYPKDKMCSWRICPSPGKRVKLDFKYFKLRERNSDNLQIFHECEPSRSTMKYCGSSKPGVLVSKCTSRCIQVWLQSDSYRTIKASRETVAFRAVASASDEGTALFNFKSLYCENDLLIKFVPNDVNHRRMIGRVVESFKNSRAGQVITISFDSYYFMEDLFGCHQRKVHANKEYYIGATRSSNHYNMKFATPTNAPNIPKKFDSELNKFKTAPPSCRPLSRGLPRPTPTR